MVIIILPKVESIAGGLGELISSILLTIGIHPDSRIDVNPAKSDVSRLKPSPREV